MDFVSTYHTLIEGNYITIAMHTRYSTPFNIYQFTGDPIYASITPTMCASEQHMAMYHPTTGMDMFMSMAHSIPVTVCFTADTITPHTEHDPVDLWAHTSRYKEMRQFCDYNIEESEHSRYIASEEYYNRLRSYIPHVLHQLKRIPSAQCASLSLLLNKYMHDWISFLKTLETPCTPQQYLLWRAYADYSQTLS